MAYNSLREHAEGTVRVEMFDLGYGCPESCASCGAYPDDRNPEDLCVREVSERRIRGCIEAIMKSTRHEVFPSYVTTNVQQEPLAGNAFFHFMRWIKKLTQGRTRAICISHGLRTAADGKIVDLDAETRLNRIVQFMDRRDVFVLSLDAMRSFGKIGDDVNIASYLETLDRLRPAIRKGARVTISIQGVDEIEPSNPLSRKHAYDILAIVMDGLRKRGWTTRERARLHKDDSRRTVKIGRAIENLPWLNPENEAPVIPDAEIVESLSRSGDLSHALRARMNCITGRLMAQVNDPLKAYRTTIEGPWDDMPLTRERPDLGKGILRAVRKRIQKTEMAVVGTEVAGVVDSQLVEEQDRLTGRPVVAADGGEGGGETGVVSDGDSDDDDGGWESGDEGPGRDKANERGGADDV